MVSDHVRFLEERLDHVFEDLDRIFNVEGGPIEECGLVIPIRQAKGPYIRKTPSKQPTKTNLRDREERRTRLFWTSVQSLMAGDESVYLSYFSVDPHNLTSQPRTLNLDPDELDE